jgi:hypothetical protein
MKTTTLLSATLCVLAAQVASAQQIYVTVDGRNVYFADVEPEMMNGRVMVPLRGVFEEMGAEVHWDGVNRAVHVNDMDSMITLRINSTTATVDGRYVELDVPAMLIRGRTMVPLRFLSENVGHDVYWNAPLRTVEITTVSSSGQILEDPNTKTIDAGTVIPFKLQTPQSSSSALVGDRFTATVNTNGKSAYEGLPVGTTVVGHVSTVRTRTSSAPGVLGLQFDRVRLPNGSTFAVKGSLIKLDSSSVINRDGVFVARNDAPDDLKFVGYGAAAGVLVAIATNGNLLTDSAIGAALGYLFGRTQVDSTKYNNVSLKAGTEIGMRLDRDLYFRDFRTTSGVALSDSSDGG